MPPEAAATQVAKQNSKVPRQRKRKRASGQLVQTALSEGRPAKQLKGTAGNLQPAAVVKHALLAQYYPVTLTLRQYVLKSLPASSKIRRRKIDAVGEADQAAAQDAQTGAQHSDDDLARLLDTTLVAAHSHPTSFKEAQPDGRFQRWSEYSQKVDDSRVSLSGVASSPEYCQTEIVDFIIWLLFSRAVGPSARPHHLLCDGFQKHAGPRQQSCSVQGLFSVCHNERVAALKQTPWPQLLSLLGRAGEGMMINMLLDWSPIFESEPIPPQIVAPAKPAKLVAGNTTAFERKPTDIHFVRSRMLYARATLSARGLVHFGLRHIPLLPGMHTASAWSEAYYHLKTDKSQVHRKTPDGHATRQRGRAKTASATSKLSGKAPRDRKKVRSTPSSANPLKFSSMTELATPVSQVSAFCQAVLSKIIPHEFWGQGDVQTHNRAMLLKNVDRFVKLRRFETMSLHEVMQGLKVTQIEWLEPPGPQNRKCSLTDFRKRSEILYELIYYVFDSIIIPLVRGNFYVTESNTHRNRVFFYRHDIWRSVAEPAIAELKVKLFEEVKSDEALKKLESRRLGYSQVRLLPKQASVRPITNLRRRMLMTKGKKVLGQSINTIMGPAYSMLKLETAFHGNRLGSAMFSVGDIYKRIDRFKQLLGHNDKPLYFAKLDVQAAFDTIPQAAVISLIRSIPTQGKYDMIRHVEFRPNESGILAKSKVMKRWHSSAKAGNDESTFLQLITRGAIHSKKDAVYVDSVFRKSHSTHELLALIDSHIRENLVKIGKKYYRQKCGIPQGSVISSMLCNYFYAGLEKKELPFLETKNCLLLRLIDDFLLITTDKNKASDFVRVMLRGMPQYGVSVSPGKTLVNFDMSVDGVSVPKTQENRRGFPYCGVQIDCHTLDITKDRGSSSAAPLRDSAISNSLTVEFSRHPGQNFGRKLINTFKTQSNIMFYDTRYNILSTVLRNLYEAFTESATKAWAYLRCLPSQKLPGPRLLIDSISRLLDVAYLLLTSSSRKLKHPKYECKLSKTQVRASGLRAFRSVLGRKQARFGAVLQWLDEQAAELAANGKACVFPMV
ncbi:telomerase reverse transcriptase [Diaporthe helianthi]|uniref:Telomerase reverse transcriptase n=1 Tax=Diaporthe helianthi TaxID=158607 RepID=A0A2P5HRN2_DIAHE|nr:telomerase reverse transcriptase [Diaporthe helianthi]